MTVQPTWRDLVRPAPAPSAGVRLALGVQLRIRQAAPARWAARHLEPATARRLAGGGELSLGARPYMRSRTTGRWVKGTVTWDAVRRRGDDLDPAAARWLAELYSISRDGVPLDPLAAATEWLALDAVTSSLLWPHLRRAAGSGVAVIAVSPDQDVTVAAGADCAVRVTRSGAGMQVRADVHVDGTPVPPGRAHVLGDGLYTAQAVGRRVSVTLAPATVDPAVATLLRADGEIAVPADEADEFTRTGLARLARRIRVVADTGVTIPDPIPPLLQVDVRFHPRDIIDCTATWAYAGGAVRGVDAPAGDDPDADLETEAVILRRIAERCPAWAHVVTAATRLRGLEAAEFAATAVPALDGLDGVHVDIHGRHPDYRELQGDPHITVTTVETTDPDWFDLGILVTIDGRTIPFAPLLRALTGGKTRLLLADGGYFSLAHPSLNRLRDLLAEAADLAQWEAGPRISRYQTTLWEDFEDLADQSEPALAWRTRAEGLRTARPAPPTRVPAGIRATLRPYQRAGFDRLAFLWEHRLGGILADDMGLGKTLQILTLIAHTRTRGESRPFLVVAPTSVLHTWRDEAERFSPGLRVRVVDATHARRRAPLDAAADIVITSYTLLRLDEAEFGAVDWAGTVLDEAQFVKNPATKLHAVVKALRSDVVFAVTGTPMENSLSELWALLSLTAPGLFPSARRFRQEYIGPIEKGKVPEDQEGGAYRAARLARLRRRIRPLVLRRTKELVAADLPAKQQQDLSVELSPAHRALYDTTLARERQKVLGLLDDLDRNRFIVFRSLTLLRMLSLDPQLVDPAHTRIGSAKLDALVDALRDVRDGGHRALVFSQFTSFLRLASDRLTAAGIDHAYLDGATCDRSGVVGTFRDGAATAFLISLKAGGFGLTLTEADYVFLLDPWWNPAAEAQAIDRTHRIGQTRSVFVYRLIAEGTIEEKVVALQERKSRLVHAVLDDGGGFATRLSADDIRGLFGQ